MAANPLPDFRASDRWITPGVVIAAVIVGGFVLAVVAASVAYLTARGIDPDPMLKLVSTVAAALGSLGTFVMTLINRSTTAKAERNSGLAPAVIADHVSNALPPLVADAVASALPPAPAIPTTAQLPPVPVPAIRQEVR